jgi:hypothetical protein
MRTLEEKVKFDSGLTIGTHPVTFVLNGTIERRALVEIGKRGKVSVLIEPDAEDMYTSWWRLKGDTSVSEGGTIVWGARDPKLRELFNNPVARIEMTR